MNPIIQGMEKMENMVSNFFRTLVRLFILTGLLGLLLGFLCSSRILTINTNNAQGVIIKGWENLKMIGQVLVEIIKGKDGNANSNGQNNGSDGYTVSYEKDPNGNYERYFLYEVRRGDTVYDISQRYQVGQEEIIRINHIRDPRKIYPRKWLRIPMKRHSAN